MRRARVFGAMAIILSVSLIAATYAGTCDDPMPARTICKTDGDCDARTTCQSVGCRGGMCSVIERHSGNACENGGACSAGMCCR